MNKLVSRWGSVTEALKGADDDALLAAVRGWIEEWDDRFWAGDFSSFDEIYASEFIGESRLPFGPSGGVHGPLGFLKFREEISAVASRFWFDIDEVQRAGDRFAGLGKMRGRGRYSGLLMRSSWAVVWTVRDGKLTRAIAFRSQSKARAELRSPSETTGRAET